MSANPNLRLVPPTGKMLKVPPTRKPNRELRTREHLTEAETKRLIEAARKGRYGHRDATLILLMLRHGLRVTEACDLRWDQIDWAKGYLHVRRLKGGIDSTHTLHCTPRVSKSMLSSSHAITIRRLTTNISCCSRLTPAAWRSTARLPSWRLTRSDGARHVWSFGVYTATAMT